MEIREQLFNISKQIQRIEDKDIDFAKNKRWISLRKKQDYMYYQYAKEEIEFLKCINDIKYIHKIIEYQKFIEDYEKK